MMFKKALFLLFVSSLLFGCGYEPLYLKNNNLEKSIKTIKFEGNEKINRKIISFLGLKEMKNSKLNFELKLISQKKLEVISKDKGGNPSVYKNSIIVDLLLNDGQKIIKQKQFNVSFVYNNINNKFDLSQYQKSIETNLIDEVCEKIFIFLKS
ncbi:hypothetical protein ABXT63_06965 [Candidatus Pelagibacter sp. Uisw_092]|uniref:hypothetical protein n=1 Tax=Candidatus Pelagibacter sp. Uisw_092 TaxID=3230979 RepID=UPI0039EC36D0